jgi:hypothetical protein
LIFSYESLFNISIQGKENKENDSPTEIETKVTLGKKEIGEIQKHISNTLHPLWQASLPANFGVAGHGKFKADQW